MKIRSTQLHLCLAVLAFPVLSCTGEGAGSPSGPAPKAAIFIASAKSLTLNVGGIDQISATVVNSTDNRLIYRSVDTTIATVDADGRIMGVRRGSTAIGIAAREDTTIRSSIVVAVVPAPAFELKALPAASTVPPSAARVPVVISRKDGFSEDVSFSVDAPDGITATFNPIVVGPLDTLTYLSLAGVPVGTTRYVLHATGNRTSVTDSTMGSVTAQEGSFTISTPTPVITMQPGDTFVMRVNVERSKGFVGVISASIGGLASVNRTTAVISGDSTGGWVTLSGFYSDPRIENDTLVATSAFAPGARFPIQLRLGVGAAQGVRRRQ